MQLVPTYHTLSQDPQGNINICSSSLRKRVSAKNLFQHGHYCYEYVRSVGSWFHAERDCMNKHGVMVFIQDIDDQNFVYNMLSNLGVYYPVWLGLHDVTNEEQWEWVSDAPLKYLNWMSSRYIDQYHDQEDCALFVHARKGEWDDVICQGVIFSEPMSHPWICQYNTTLSHISFG